MRVRMIGYGVAVIAVLAATGSNFHAAQPKARDAGAVAARLDREIDARLAAANIPASAPASDAEFLRRATVDILGRTPTPDRVRAFLADTSSDKRRKLIDELLASPESGRYFGAVWYDLLVKDVTSRVGPQVFENWLADQFNANRGWDAAARDVLTASGKLDVNPPAVVWFSHSEPGAGKEQAKLKPNDLFGTFAQKFLGQRLQCAECHNHPFTKFKQDDFWAATALVSKAAFKDSDRDSLRGNLRVKGEKKKVDPAIPTVLDLSTGTARVSIAIPETGRTATAKFPDGSAVLAGAKDPRAALAAWATTSPAFARAMANRVWAQFMGRGFVNPVDDFREDNPATHPDALQLLADEFAASGFDLKHLMRCVALTKAYGRSSDALPGNAKDDVLFSHAEVRPMCPGVLFHAVSGGLGRDGSRLPVPVVRANNDRNPEHLFARRFKGDDDEEPELAEYGHGVPQVLYLLNAGVLDPRPVDGKPLRKFDGGDTVARALKAGDADKAVDVLYLAAFARFPTAAERTKVKAAVAREKDAATGYAVVLWALLNSSEFQFNH